MIKRKDKRVVYFILLLFLIMFVSVGYAVLSSNLNVIGSSTINNPIWDIHFENVVVSSESVNADVPTIDSLRTTVTYNVVLTKPGDFFEFTVDVVNGGTIDAMVDTVVSMMNGSVITTLPNYLNYNVTYDDGVEIKPYHLLSSSSSEKYKVMVEYKKDISQSDMPTTVETLNFSFSVKYVQSDSNAKQIRRTVYFGTTNSGIYYINQSFDEDYGDIFNTKEEAIYSYNSIYGVDYFYLKSILKNNIFTDSYLTFIIKDDLANNYPGLTAGTYTLNVGGASKNIGGYYNNDSIIFESNKAILLNAFSSDYCHSSYLLDNDSEIEAGFECWIENELSVYITKQGSVQISNLKNINNYETFSCGAFLWSGSGFDYNLACFNTYD